MKINEKKKEKKNRSQNIKYKSCLSPDNNKKNTFFFSFSLASFQYKINSTLKKKNPHLLFPQTKSLANTVSSEYKKTNKIFARDELKWIDVRILTSSSAPTHIIFTFIFWLIHFTFNCMVCGGLTNIVC